MKRIYYLLLMLAVSFTACKKDDAEVKGSLTAKMSFYDSTAQTWSPNEDFIATTVVTKKTGSNYTINATDANKNAFTLNLQNVTGPGTYTTVNTALVKGGKSLDAMAGNVVISAVTDNSLTATFIFEDVKWSVFDGKVTASF